jgi:hypothetical protein
MAKSEYLQREEAAKRQLGSKGVSKRVRQLPTAARATARGFVRELTGIDVSRRGVTVDPLSVAIALPVGKVLKASKLLREAGNIERAVALESKLAVGKSGEKAFQLYKGKNVRIGTFDNISSAKVRAQGLMKLETKHSGRVYSGPDFRVVDPVTGKTIIRIK